LLLPVSTSKASRLRPVLMTALVASQDRSEQKVIGRKRAFFCGLLASPV
jgi:hypothetical protein